MIIIFMISLIVTVVVSGFCFIMKMLLKVKLLRSIWLHFNLYRNNVQLFPDTQNFLMIFPIVKVYYLDPKNTCPRTRVSKIEENLGKFSARKNRNASRSKFKLRGVVKRFLNYPVAFSSHTHDFSQKSKISRNNGGLCYIFFICIFLCSR